MKILYVIVFHYFKIPYFKILDSPILDSFGPSHQRCHKSRVSLRGPRSVATLISSLNYFGHFYFLARVTSANPSHSGISDLRSFIQGPNLHWTHLLWDSLRFPLLWGLPC
jgi:hypothetical protein